MITPDDRGHGEIRRNNNNANYTPIPSDKERARDARRSDTRKQEIVEAALRIAEEVGLCGVTRDEVADRAGCSAGLVNHYFGTMSQLQRATIGEAVRVRNLTVLAQGLVMGHPKARNAPEEMRRAAADSIVGG